jgi:hypothetical protein
MAAIIKPVIAGYGSSFGKFSGILLTDYSVSSDIDTGKLNKNLMVDGVEFNLFEQTIKDYILGSLGEPTIKVELTPFQLKLAIDEAITKLDYHSPLWATQYAVFDASAGQNVYEIPLFILNNLVDVQYKRNILAVMQSYGTMEMDFFLQYFSTFRIFNSFNIGDYYLLQMYLKQTKKVLSQYGSWDIISGKYLQIHPTPVFEYEPVILEYRALDSDTVLPEYRNWVQRYATAIAKGILGTIRGKYATLPGPGGGTQLDGATLREESKVEKEELMDELRYAIEGPPMFSVA